MLFSVAVLVATSILGASASPLHDRATPCTGRKTVNHGGVKLAICPKTSFAGETVSELPGITDATACAKACAVTARCQRAVYDKVGKYCLFKAASNNVDANADNNYDSITVTEEIEDGKKLDKCTLGYDKVLRTSKTVPYLACANADFLGNSIDILGNVASPAACAELCAPRRGCFAAVYVAEAKACHIKAQSFSNDIFFRRGLTRLAVANYPAEA